MASLQAQLEQALNDIFDSCCDEESVEASIDKLATECVQKFATGKTQLTSIITKKLNASNEKTFISREQFLEKLTVWISEQNTLPTTEIEITYEQNTSSDSSFSNDRNFIFSSTPHSLRSKSSLIFLKDKFLERKKGDVVVDDHTPNIHQMEIDLSRERIVKDKLQDKTNVLENIVSQQEHRFQTIKETNVSLENRLTSSEQRNILLESELQRRNIEFNQQIERNQEENMHLANLISELEEKLEKYNTKYSELNSENQIIKAELERCRFTESNSKKELQIEFDNLYRTTSIEIKKNETQIQLLNKELRKSNEAEEELQKTITEYRKENLALHSNQKELLETIGDLREEKRTLQEKIIEMQSLENVTFASFNNYDSIGRDGEQDSIRSIFHETENYGQLWGNREYTDDRNQEENTRLANLVSQLEKKLEKSNTKYSELNSENQIIKAELERCRCNELITKTQELQLELDNVHKTTLTEKKENETQIHLLNKEFRKSEEELQKMIIEYRKDNLALHSNQKELLETIGDLREEKRVLQVVIDEIQSLENVTIATMNNDIIEHDEQQDSVNSISSIHHENENHGQLWGNSEHTDDRNQEENTRLANLVSQLEKKLEKSNTKYSELNSENQIIKAELERCRCNELVTKTQELQLELDNVHKTTSTEIKEYETQVHLLNKELRKSEEELQKMIVEYRNDNLALHSNQIEILETIGQTIATINNVIIEHDEQQDSVNSISSIYHETETIATINNDIIEHDEQQDSVNSISSIFHETENHGALWGNSEHTDDRAQSVKIMNQQLSDSDEVRSEDQSNLNVDNSVALLSGDNETLMLVVEQNECNCEDAQDNVVLPIKIAASNLLNPENSDMTASQTQRLVRWIQGRQPLQLQSKRWTQPNSWLRDVPLENLESTRLDLATEGESDTDSQDQKSVDSLEISNTSVGAHVQGLIHNITGQIVEIPNSQVSVGVEESDGAQQRKLVKANVTLNDESDPSLQIGDVDVRRDKLLQYIII